MKLFSLLILSALFTSAPAVSVEPEKQGCGCVNCSCNPDSHCGCYSKKGCHCENGECSKGTK